MQDEKFPLTNLECESELAKLENQISFNGGSTSTATPSQKNIVATNGFLVDSSFTEISDFDKRQKWRCGRNAPKVKLAKRLNGTRFYRNCEIADKINIVEEIRLEEEKSHQDSKITRNLQRALWTS